ncbi:PilX N-terminal domain-containing pilus assembly protein [Thiopseudomonas alkaliphila]|uniref:PilX N-terminal domain-containing pilus assembly protein n=1 Tax=Thiopseudomonas alkaliphila TaxID=1697053 RepID=UPI00069FB973|nr:PilX N-terminal domain-containing pilus assembly protein [Thiopseudomonas alkaliphila]
MRADQQQGAALLVSLVLLMLMSLLVISVVDGVILETRITGVITQQHSLEQAAEYGLKQAEQQVYALSQAQQHPWLLLNECGSAGCIKPLLTQEQLQEFYQAELSLFQRYDAQSQRLAGDEQLQVRWLIGWVSPVLLKATVAHYSPTALPAGAQYFIVNVLSQTEAGQHVQLQTVLADFWLAE